MHNDIPVIISKGKVFYWSRLGLLNNGVGYKIKMNAKIPYSSVDSWIPDEITSSSRLFQITRVTHEAWHPRCPEEAVYLLTHLRMAGIVWSHQPYRCPLRHIGWVYYDTEQAINMNVTWYHVPSTQGRFITKYGVVQNASGFANSIPDSGLGFDAKVVILSPKILGDVAKQLKVYFCDTKKICSNNLPQLHELNN